MKYNWKRARDGLFNLGIVLVGTGMLEIIFIGGTTVSVGVVIGGVALIFLSGVRDSP